MDDELHVWTICIYGENELLHGYEAASLIQGCSMNKRVTSSRTSHHAQIHGSMHHPWDTLRSIDGNNPRM